MQKGSVIPYDGPRGRSWQIQYRDSEGRQVKKTIGREADGVSKKDAQAALAEMVSKVANKRWRKPDTRRFAEYADKWAERKQAQGDWTPDTAMRYRPGLTKAKARFGRLALGDIRRRMVNDYISELSAEFAPRTVRVMHSVLHGVLDAAVKDELIDSNPAHGADLPKIEDYEPRFLTIPEARAIESKFQDPLARLAFISLERLGLRLSELLNVQWADVDLLGRRFYVRKSKTKQGKRWVALPSGLAAEWETHYQRSNYTAETDFVFAHPRTGKRWSGDYYRTALHEAREKAGIEWFRPAHDLRVTSITSGILNGEEIPKLMQRVGHRNYATTQVYVQLAGRVFHDDADALEALRLGQPVKTAEED